MQILRLIADLYPLWSSFFNFTRSTFGASLAPLAAMTNNEKWDEGTCRLLLLRNSYHRYFLNVQNVYSKHYSKWHNCTLDGGRLDGDLGTGLYGLLRVLPIRLVFVFYLVKRLMSKQEKDFEVKLRLPGSRTPVPVQFQKSGRYVFTMAWKLC